MTAVDTRPAPLTDPPRAAPVREADEVHADMIEAAQAEHDGERLFVEFGGQRFTARTHRPVGAFAVMCARLKSKDGATITAAPIQLLMAWIEKDEHDALFEAIGEVDDLEAWMGGEFRVAMEALANRPSQAP